MYAVSALVRDQRKKRADVKHVPTEVKWEQVPRRRHYGKFDNVILTLNLLPGAGGLNAVVVSWKNPVRDHDIAAGACEKQMFEVDSLRKEFVAKNRTYKNWETAWLLMNDRPEELEEYLELRPKMGDFKERVTLMKKTEEKVQAEQQWRRYHELKLRCERLLEARDTLREIKRIKDNAFQGMKHADQHLEKLFELERETAEKISEDHVLADQQSRSISELFPAVCAGMIITEINGIATEGAPWAEVHQLLQDAQQPHSLEFRRYDYRENSVSGKWEPLQVLRERGQYVEDPRVGREMFAQACRAGVLEIVLQYLEEGQEVDAQDATQCTGLHHAAANGHLGIISALLKAGASMEARDANKETPLAASCRRGELDGAALLLAHGASCHACDRAGRSVLIHAVLSGSASIVEILLSKMSRDSSRWLPDKLWNWTPLHYASSSGLTPVVDLLLKHSASPYALSSDGSSPFKFAKLEVQMLIRQYILKEPAQCVLPAGLDRGALWLGSRQAAYPQFATDRGFTSILSIFDRGQKDPKLRWMADATETAGLERHEIVISADDTTSHDTASWYSLTIVLKDCIDFVHDAIERKRVVLVHCDLGVCTSLCVVLAYMLTKRRLRLNSSLKHLEAIRPQLQLDIHLRRGLEAMERSLDARKLRRLEDRLRKAPVLALRF
mmetsp:Transcript_11672/g.40071  ORF Transcript_11672/g.40071 Transcript_11672/m.40071 type:complete len:670 (-) Transcript_11672:71-2080(-)